MKTHRYSVKWEKKKTEHEIKATETTHWIGIFHIKVLIFPICTAENISIKAKIKKTQSFAGIHSHSHRKPRELWKEVNKMSDLNWTIHASPVTAATLRGKLTVFTAISLLRVLISLVESERKKNMYFFFGVTKKFPWCAIERIGIVFVVVSISVSLHFAFIFFLSKSSWIGESVCARTYWIRWNCLELTSVCMRVFSFHFVLKTNKFLPKCFVRQINFASLCGYIWHSSFYSQCVYVFSHLLISLRSALVRERKKNVNVVQNWNEFIFFFHRIWKKCVSHIDRKWCIHFKRSEQIWVKPERKLFDSKDGSS